MRVDEYLWMGKRLVTVSLEVDLLGRFASLAARSITSCITLMSDDPDS